MLAQPLLSEVGIRKAAILLIGVGRDAAARVLAHLSEPHVEALSAEIARLENISAAESTEVFKEFHVMTVARGHALAGGLTFAQSLLEDSLGAEKASEIMSRLNAAAVQMPFQFLHRADPSQVRSFISGEHSQVIALVLSHMTSEKASLLLSGLPATQQTDVAHRIATMGRPSPELVRNVEASLERKLSSMLAPADTSKVGGLDPLVDIINRADRSTERQIVEGLAEVNAELAEEIKARMFMFEDIVGLDDKSVQLVLRQVEVAQLALALKGVAEAVRAKVISNLSTRSAENLVEESQMLGAVRITQVEEAQQAVIRAIRLLEEQGQIHIRRGTEEAFVE